MDYFNAYSSNTYAGSGNQYYFTMDENEVRTGRVFYKIAVGGKFNYSILFSNTIDSTYADGSKSQANLVCGQWTIHSAKVGKCKKLPEGDSVLTAKMSDSKNDNADIYVEDLKPLYFDGTPQKDVLPGELFSTDKIELEFEKSEYLCLEITFSGKMIPYHEESILPVYIKENGTWKYSKYMPFASMIGCDRQVTKRVGYLGDSITQGIGTPLNSYLHWNARLSEKLNPKNSYWNLGIGYGRANDAATDGAWLFKAKKCDVVFVCYGVNDIFRIGNAGLIKNNLLKIVKILKSEGKTVIIQTVPPFDYDEGTRIIWENVNQYIKTDLAKNCDGMFDCVPILGKDVKNPHLAKYGGHPDSEGCKVWAEALLEYIKGNKDLFLL